MNTRKRYEMKRNKNKVRNCGKWKYDPIYIQRKCCNDDYFSEKKTKLIKKYWSEKNEQIKEKESSKK